MNDKIREFERERKDRIASYGREKALQEAAHQFLSSSVEPKYSYNFSWLGIPIIQYPQDIVAVQEVIWNVQPDCVIETGIARGGSLIFSASLLELIHSFGGPDGKVLGVDIDIREHNRRIIEEHPLSKRIQMFEGSSIDPEIVAEVKQAAAQSSRVLVLLDSMHTHDHVLNELMAYAPLTTKGSYCIVFDTLIEHMPEGSYPDRPWGTGNSPASAVTEFLATHNGFEVDREIEEKLLITVSPGGYLKRVA